MLRKALGKVLQQDLAALHGEAQTLWRGCAASSRCVSSMSSGASSTSSGTAAAKSSIPACYVVSVPHKTGWQAVPAVPKGLGLLGLLPFYALSPPILSEAARLCSDVEGVSALLQQIQPMAASLQIGYGTAIVSFLGAVHWGAAMQSRSGHTTKIMFERYIWSVMPGLCAFPASAMSVGTGSAMITMSLLAAFAVDAKFAWKGALPPWYMSLRVPLTLGAVGGMLCTMWHAFYEEQTIADYEHVVAHEPMAVETEPPAVHYRSFPKDRKIMKLYYFALPGYAEASRIMLRIAGEDFEDVRFADREEWATKYKSLSPTGQAPFLVLDSGETICQSSAIDRYAAKLGGFLPGDPIAAAKVDMLMACIEEVTMTVYPTFQLPTLDEKIAARQKLFDAGGAAALKLQVLEKLLAGRTSEFCATDKLTLADIRLFVSFSQMISGFMDGITPQALAPYTAICALRVKIAQHPDIAPIYAGCEDDAIRQAFMA